MKHFKFLFIISIIIASSTAFAKPSSVQRNKYFDNIKIYLDRDYVLNDTIEFAIFDMSEVKLINDSKSGLDEAKAVLEKLPTNFFRNLKAQIIQQKVPITLYSGQSPSYAKPLELTVKIKRIHLKPQQVVKDDAPIQPVSVRIYGQLRDKNSGEILFKFYDAEEDTFIVGKNKAQLAFNDISAKLMKNLALYLRTKY